MLSEAILSISRQLTTAKETYAELQSKTFILYASLDEGFQTSSPQGDGKHYNHEQGD